MAGVTFLPVAPSVLILHSVTGNTGRTDALVFLPGVTRRA